MIQLRKWNQFIEKCAETDNNIFHAILNTKLPRIFLLTMMGIAMIGIVVLIIMPPVIAPSQHASTSGIYGEHPINSMWGDKIKVNDDFEASKLAGFTIHFPSKIPDGFHLQLAMVDPTIENNKYVRAFYSTDAISNTMTLYDFFAQKGIYIYYTKMPIALKDVNLFNTILSSHVHEFQNHGYVDVHEVEINGYHGTVYEQRDLEFQGSSIHRPSQLELFVGDSDITMQAYLPDSTLINIAKSISS